MINTEDEIQLKIRAMDNELFNKMIDRFKIAFQDDQEMLLWLIEQEISRK